ncbi:uncharacterized protein [Palaemon carinicauda]|uniref:uncharacterized protein n=1 Tax=Palaemon carinicauda TaxID=392227 RepID=UPI0035B61486
MKNKEPTYNKCPACNNDHHAWNDRCPARLNKIDQERTRITGKAVPPRPQRATRWSRRPPSQPQTSHTHTEETQQTSETESDNQPTTINSANPEDIISDSNPTEIIVTDKGAQTVKEAMNLVCDKTGDELVDFIRINFPDVYTESLVAIIRLVWNPNYKAYRTHRTNTTRGLLTLVKNTIPSKAIANIDCHETETLSIQITLVNTTLTVHNIYKASHKHIDATLLFATADTENTVISGDFNAHHTFLNSTQPTNPTGTHLAAVRVDFDRVKLLNDTNIATHSAGGRLDLTFVSENLVPGSTWDLYPVLLSDHFGINFTVQMEKLPAPPPPLRRWNQDLAKWELFEKHVTSWADQYDPETNENIDQLQNNIHQGAPKSRQQLHAREENPRHKTEELHRTLLEVTDCAVAVANEVKIQKWLDSCSEMTLTFTREELEKALAKTKNTAPGIDGLTYSMLRNKGNPAKGVYLHIINKTFVDRCRPLTWNQQNIHPISKSQEENAYRPIALISCTEKVAERMVLNRLKWKVGRLHPRLYGFTEGIGTHECIVDVMATINNKKALIVFMDLEKAYELASAQAILFSLVVKRVRGHLLSWVEQYVKNREARVSFQGATSPFLPLENSTPQGGILSPFLFNILMENLLALELPGGIEIFIYADDICIVCPHTVQNKPGAMQRALDVISGGCRELGLKVNSIKTKAMAIKHDYDPPNLILNNTPIEWVDNYKYLGVIINKFLNPASQVKHLRHAVTSRYVAMKRLATLSKGASHQLLRKFHIQAIVAQVEYTAPILTCLPSRLLTSLEVIQNNSMRLITGAPMWTRLQLLRAETGLMPLADRIDLRLCAIISKTIRADRVCPLSNKIRGLINLHEDLDPPPNYVGRLLQAIRRVNMQQEVLAMRPDKNHVLFNPPAPWIPDPININFTILPTTKALCSPQEMLQAAMYAINKTNATDNYFTDGSVDRDIPATAAAVFSDNYVASWRVSDHASTLQTEQVAIAKALANSLSRQGDTTVHTDSRGAIQAILKNPITENVLLVTTIKATAQIHAQGGRKVTLNWIPSHVGIQGNEEADRLANNTLRCATIGVSLSKSLGQLKKLITYTCFSRVKSEVLEAARWGSMSARWYTNVTGMDPHDITRNTGRGLATVIHRLRLGYLCNWQVIGDEERPCKYCEDLTGEDPLEHYLLTCPSTTILRQSITSPPPMTAETITKHVLRKRRTQHPLQTLLCLQEDAAPSLPSLGSQREIHKKRLDIEACFTGPLQTGQALGAEQPVKPGYTQGYMLMKLKTKMLLEQKDYQEVYPVKSFEIEVETYHNLERDTSNNVQEAVDGYERRGKKQMMKNLMFGGDWNSITSKRDLSNTDSNLVIRAFCAEEPKGTIGAEPDTEETLRLKRDTEVSENEED